MTTLFEDTTEFAALGEISGLEQQFFAVDQRRHYPGGGILSPLGVATDSLGNVSIANSGAIQLPCSIKAVPMPGNTVLVTEISRGGSNNEWSGTLEVEENEG